MKVLITVLFVVLSLGAFAQGGWIDVTPSDTMPRLLGIYALDENNIWVVGVQGTILHTIDGGLNWLTIQSDITVGLGKVQFISPDTGWVASTHTIYRTTDGGSSWAEQGNWNANDEICDMVFIRDLPGEPVRGFVTGGLQETWRTDDAGETWVQIRGACGNGSFLSCSFVDKNTGWFVGAPSTSHPETIMRTTDGGNTFEEQTNPIVSPFLRDVYFINDQRGLAVGIYGQTIYTSDGGANWEARPNGSIIWMEVVLTETGKAWAVGLNGKIAHSTDWGYTWQMQESGVSDILWGIHFINDNEGWVVGQISSQWGVMLHTTNGGVTFVEEKQIDEIPTTYSLSNNFPNPFNPSTKIQYSIPHSAKVQIKIFDMLGNEIETLINEEKSVGTYELSWNAIDQPSGVYFYQIKAGKFIQTKKMILIK
jgi:photosystem II stability/assembly factor-like uncharacterized protein